MREAFFVSFLGSLGVGAEEAFAAGFLYFLVTLLLVEYQAGSSWSGGLARRSAAPRRPWLVLHQVAAVVVTYDALPWIEQCLESLRGSRRSSSTTARETARSISCVSASQRYA